MFKYLFALFVILLSSDFSINLKAAPVITRTTSWVNEISQVSINSYNVITYKEDGGPFGRFSGEAEVYTVFYPLITCTSGEKFVAWQYKFNSRDTCIQETPSFLKSGKIVEIISNIFADGGFNYILKDVETGAEIFVYKE